MSDTQIPVAEQSGVRSFTPKTLCALRGVKINVSRNKYDCYWCDTGTVKMYPSERELRERVFCSEECRAEWLSDFNSGQNHPRYNKVTLECETCGDEFGRWPSQVQKYEHHFCSKECANKFHEGRFAGEDNAMWEGGWSPESFGDNWHEQREKALERDDYECQDCELGNEQHQQTFGHGLHVHHLTPRSEFEDLEKANEVENLVTLCNPCHQWREKA